MRIEIDPDLTLLRPGGLLEAAAFLLFDLFSMLWLRHARGTVSIDLAALHLEGRHEGTGATSEPTPDRSAT